MPAIVKGVGFAATLIGGFAGGYVARALPMATSLWIGGILQAARISRSPGRPDRQGHLRGADGRDHRSENFTGAIGTVIFVGYLSALCKNPLHTATQFALLTALSAVGRTYLSSGAGYVAQSDRLGLVLRDLRVRRDCRDCCCSPGCRRAGISAADCQKTRPLPDRRRERALVEIIELAADRHAVRKPRHLHVRVAQQVGDVVRGGLAVDGGVEREDHLAHRRIMRARDQRIDRQIARADAVERRKRAAKHMIARIDRAGALQRPQIGDVRHHDDDRGSRRGSVHTVQGFCVSMLPQVPAHHDFLDRGLQRARPAAPSAARAS